MTSRHERVSEIFLRATELEGEERRRFLEEACAGDDDLRAEVESLLAHDEGTETGSGTEVVATRLREAAAETVRARSEQPLPQRIGPYRILGLLGEGGMGIVYRAEQVEPIRREVALKVIKGGQESSRVLSRFESERQTLALMDHPNIAKVLDAGSDEGRPYFAMELVRGVPITVYCRENRLDVQRRLRLFLDVCRAVGHAHQRGIIHRDLKPSNVLVPVVQGNPVPKVIDFSLAKALEDGDGTGDQRTRTGQLVGTLRYMSPEQARGDVAAVDTRSDVYALGLILYKLLTDRLPYDVDDKPMHEVVRAICQDPPRSLRGASTTSSGRIDADVETIARKCLEKDPDARYGTASELATDVERHLDSLPILARPPSTAYQIRKLVGRHRIAFGFSAVVLLFLVVYGVTVSVQLGIQKRERERALLEARKAGRVTEFLQEMLAAVRPEEEGQEVTVREVLEQAVENLESGLSEEPEVEAAVRHTIGDTYISLGALDEAEVQLLRALEMHPDPASVHMSLAHLRLMQERLDEAVEESRLAVDAFRASDRPDRIADALSVLGIALVDAGRMVEAEEALRESFAIREGMRDGSEEAEKQYWLTAENLANVLFRRGNLAEAEKYVRGRLENRRRAKGDLNPGVATSLHNLAVVVSRQGKYAEAVPLYRESLAIEEKLDVTGAKHAKGFVSLASCLLSSGDAEEAETVIRRAVAMYGNDSTPGLGQALANLSAILTAQEKFAEAERSASESVSILRSTVGDRSYWVAKALGARARALEGLDRNDEAERSFRESIEILEEALPEGHAELATGWHALGTFLSRRGRFDEAEPLIDRALGLRREKLGERHPDYAMTLAARAFVLDGTGRAEEAAALYEKALETLTGVLGDNHPSVAEVRDRQARQVGS